MSFLNSYPRRPIVYLFIHLPLFKEICTLDSIEKSLVFPESDSKHRFSTPNYLTISMNLDMISWSTMKMVQTHGRCDAHFWSIK